MDFFLVEKIAVKRIQQRCIDRDAHSLVFRLDGESGVVVARDEWQRIGRDFRFLIVRSARLLRWAVLLQIPVGLLLLALFTATRALRRGWDAIDSVVPGLTWLVLSVALPVAALVYHGISVRRAIDAVVAHLAKRPRVAIAAHRAARGLNAIEIVALVLFGPGCFIEVYGTLRPHAFDFTPWMGRHLQWDGIVGLAAFAVILTRHALRRRGAWHASPPAASSVSRRRALVARAELP